MTDLTKQTEKEIAMILLSKSTENRFTTISFNPEDFDKAISALASFIQTKQREAAIDFGTWYSGMEQQKVEKAYERFLEESSLASKTE